MSSQFNFYGLNASELVLFVILVYLAVLLIVIVIVRQVHLRALCPFSGQCIHCSYCYSCARCPRCSLQQSPKSVFCCKRKHSIYETNWIDDMPSLKLGCFKPDCAYLRCCCCEFYVMGAENPKEEQAPSVITLDKVVVDV